MSINSNSRKQGKSTTGTKRKPTPSSILKKQSSRKVAGSPATTLTPNKVGNGRTANSRKTQTPATKPKATPKAKTLTGSRSATGSPRSQSQTPAPRQRKTTQETPTRKPRAPAKPKLPSRSRSSQARTNTKLLMGQLELEPQPDLSMTNVPVLRNPTGPFPDTHQQQIFLEQPLQFSPPNNNTQ